MTNRCNSLIYLDANASYGPLNELRGAILGDFYNPNSIHRAGQRGRAVIEEARKNILKLVGAGAHDTLIFTSGATESNNQAILSLTHRLRNGEAIEVVTCSTEHPAVLAPVKYLKELGAEVRIFDPLESGEINVELVVKNCTPKTTFLSLMLANNETGAITKISEIAREVKKISPDIIIHSDGVQMLGKEEFSFKELGIDLLTITGHKMGAPSGTGALIIKEGIHIPPLIIGGPQELRLRSGTENVLGISLLGKVSEIVSGTLPTRKRKMEEARNYFEGELKKRCGDIEVNCRDIPRLPNTSSIFIPGIMASDLLIALDQDGVCISSGAACSSGKPEPSHVLLGMGHSHERIMSTVRVSFRADHCEAEILNAIEFFEKGIRRCREVR